MTESRSAIYYRTLIRASVGSPGNPEDIANINTAPLPNGSECYVTENRSVYRLAKFSTTAAFGNVVIAPIAGGGRWFLVGAASSAISAYVYSTLNQQNSFDADGSLHPSSTANFAASASGLWIFSASGAHLTYIGPTTRAKVTLSASMQVNAEPLSVYLGVSYDDDLLSVVVAGSQGGPQGVNFYVQSTGTGGDNRIAVSQRVIEALTTGDTIQPVFGSASAEATGTISSMQLVVEAA